LSAGETYFSSSVTYPAMGMSPLLPENEPLTYAGTLDISFPADGELVPGSQYIEVTAIGKL